MLTKTPTVAVDEDFTYVGQVTKANERPDGTRIIRGVASGITEDRDGERVSRRAIAKMVTESASAARKGELALTSSHQQDWATEFGQVVSIEHDRTQDEMLVETVLPAEGQDPLADKAWRAMQAGKKLGFSIGGKLRKAYFEQDGDTGKRRKVLDDIALRHVMLTEHPSYSPSFAQAVAKSFTGEQPADDAFVEPVDPADEVADAEAIVAKAKPPEDEDADGPPAATGATGPGADGDQTDDGGDAKAADGADGDGAEGDEPTDAEAAKDLPLAKRHLACPQCGHEFAADLPADEPAGDTTNEDDADTGKSTTKENTVAKTESETLAAIRALVDGADVAKTTTTEVEAPVEKATTEHSDVEKMLAASHAHAEDRLDTLTEGVTAAFTAVEKSLQGVIERIDTLPQGRKSVARVLPTREEVAKTAGDEDLDAEDAVEKAASPVGALKALNAQRGIK